MIENHVVTCFLVHQGKVMILKRSGRVGSYQERWAGISGYIETGTTPLQQAFQELNEEAGLRKEEVLLEKEGAPVEVVDNGIGKKWVVHPFRFSLSDPKKIKIDWEHTEYRWIAPGDINRYETVPKLVDAWEQVK